MSDVPGRMHVLLEGPTERVLFDQVFAPYWEARGWIVTSSVIVTTRHVEGGVGRGGVSRWAKLDKEIRKLLGSSHLDLLTTMIDYYGVPADTPGMRDRPPHGTPMERVGHVETSMVGHFADRRFIPHLTLHESEAWVFAAGCHLAELAGDPALHRRLQNVVAEVGGPEHINEGQETAPSKRLERLWPGYRKVSDGPRAVADLGLEALRRQCPHLDSWLSTLDAMQAARPRWSWPS